MPCPGAQPNRRERILASGRERPGIPWAGQPCRCLAAPAGAAATDSPGWRRRDREPSASESHRVLPGCRLAPRFPASPAPNAARRRRWQSAALMTALRHVAVAARSTTHECTTAFEAPSAVAMASVMMATMVAVMMMSVTVDDVRDRGCLDGAKGRHDDGDVGDVHRRSRSAERQHMGRRTDGRPNRRVPPHDNHGRARRRGAGRMPGARPADPVRRRR